MDICPKCGLPLQACVCKEMAKSGQEVEVRLEKRRFGKFATLVAGLKDVDIKEIAKRLKSELACGGTIKNNIIELQGNHRGKVKPILLQMGFDAGQVKE